MAEHPSDEWIEAANCLATVAHQLSSVMHEANNMLQVIAGSAEMIQLDPALPETVLRRSTTIADHAHRVSALLGSVRELSRYAPHQDGETTDLASVARAALSMRRHALNRAHTALTVEGGDVPVVVRASWRSVMQMLLNLLLNAEDAVKGRSGAAIAIRFERAGSDVILSVRDNGPGLHTRAEMYALTPLDDGAPRLGLGLSACERLARREGGSLAVRSDDGGTTAVLMLRA